MRRLPSALVVCCVLILGSRAQPVYAQSEPATTPSDAASSDAARAQASAHFKQGAELFEGGFYRAALVELKRAYEIAPNYRLLYNIGNTHVALSEFVEAVGAFEEYLAQGGAAVPPARRTELEADLQRLRRHVAVLTIRVNRDGAVVLVDDKEIGKSPLAQSVSVNVGHHRISARTDDGLAASAEVNVAGGDRKEVALALIAARKADESVAQIAPTAEPKPKFSKRQKWAIGGLSSAGALGIVGGALALVARSARDDYQHKLDARPGDAGAIEGARDRLWRTSLAADIMWGTALLTGASGLVLLLVKDRHDDQTPKEKTLDIQVGLAPRAFVAEGRF